MPKISIVIPFHWVQNWDFFLTRCLESIEQQTFTDYEIILTKSGSMPVNSNRAIQSAKGDLIKILFMDDYFAHLNALQEIVNNFEGEWLITGTNTNPEPYWTDDIIKGNNKLGSPSALTMRKNSVMLFDERMSWLLDCDLYQRLYVKYGLPNILKGVNVNLGIHSGQMTNILTDEEKLAEHKLIQEKYGR